MRAKKYYAVGLFFSVFFLMAVGPCQNAATRFSFNEVSSDGFGSQVEAQYDALLQRYVTSKSLVRYAAWRSSPSDIAALKAVIEAMGKVDDASMTPDQRKAFYLNAYNALTLDLILSHYDETLGRDASPYPDQRSIRNIGDLDTRVWDQFKWQVAGKSRSLNDLENRILRPMGDARIHFAIVCASKGCPPLYGHAFLEKTLSSTLDRLSDTFVNAGRSTQFDSTARTIRTSHVLDWFGQDFVRSFGSLQAFFEKYVRVISPQDVRTFRTEYTDYDWTLNEDEEDPNPNPTGSGTENEMAEPGEGSGTEHGPSPVPTPSVTPSPGGSGTERSVSA